MEGVASLLPLVLIIGAFWWLLIRPQRKRQNELLRTQRGVEPGDEVVLGSGIYGTVRDAEDDTLQLEVAPGTTVKVARGAVMRVLSDRPAEDDAEWTDHSGDAADGSSSGD